MIGGITIMGWLEERIFQFQHLVEYRNQQQIWNAIEFLGDCLRTLVAAEWRLPDGWEFDLFRYQPLRASELIRNDRNYLKMCQLIYDAKVHSEHYREDWEPIDRDDDEFHEEIARLMDEWSTEMDLTMADQLYEQKIGTRDFLGREQASDVIELKGCNKKLITKVCSSGIVKERLKPMLWIDSTLQRTTVWGEHLMFLTCVGGARAEGAHLFRLLALAPMDIGTSNRSLDDAVATDSWELLGDDDEERNEAERKFLRAPRSDDDSRPGTPRWYKWNEWTICDLTRSGSSWGAARSPTSRT